MVQFHQTSPKTVRPPPPPGNVAHGDYMNLTPASETLSSTKNLSSTRASVDSDSDYQAINNVSTSSNPSRPVSRSSTFSALSTTATKDGVEGKRIHRSHDPVSYYSWIYSTNASSGTKPESPSETLVEGEDGQSINSGADEENDNYSYDSDATSDYTSERTKPAPPNIPSAPPVTLNEKIRLLRTGSVSGNGGGTSPSVERSFVDSNNNNRDSDTSSTQLVSDWDAESLPSTSS